LIYTLEEKAKAAGGYIHFILGNHEVMNLSGDARYHHAKYKRNLAAMDISIKDLYGSNSELGRWLRTKNVIEKIGNLLFIHAGISSEMLNLGYSVTEINSIARPYLDKKKSDPGDTSVIVNGVGPLWFRGYYKKPFASIKLIDSTLKFYAVDHIITGHTIISDTITMLHNGKIFNTDTRHNAGFSEALLLSGAKFFRVNNEGRKSLLYIEEKEYQLHKM
jgi:hypothetical protein